MRREPGVARGRSLRLTLVAAVAVVLAAALLVGLLGLVPATGPGAATPSPAPIVFPTSLPR